MPASLRTWIPGLVLLLGTAPLLAAIHVTPPSVVLDNPEATQQLLVTEDGPRPVDRTRSATYRVTQAGVVAIDATGLMQPVGEGRTDIEVSYEGMQARVTVEVKGLLHPQPISFSTQVIPVLTKASCNAGGCHGKAEGQNGFKLSVFGFDPHADHQALVAESRGRRVFAASPDQSLLLRKGAALTPHGGGRKLVPDGLPYQRLRRWIAEGLRYDTPDTAPVVGLEVEPAQRVLAFKGTQQLRATAIDAHGKRYCVTAEAEYDSNAGTIAGVDRRGWVQAGSIPGEAAILVRYMGQVAVCRVTIPRPGVSFPRPPEQNFIDGHVWNKLERLGIPPSPLCDDATFLRRAFLDTIGTLPTAAEARAFLTDTSADKRAKLVDRLLQRPEYADYWTMIWSDILRVDRDAVTPQGSVAMTRWLRRHFAENRPYDQLARELLTVRGSTTAEGPAAFYKVLGTPEIVSRSISQVFLGIRIECAQCHHHPSEKWGQDDYFALAGLFTGVQQKALPGGEMALVVHTGADMKHPRTGKAVPAKPLGAEPAEIEPAVDRRQVLARWMTGPSNPYFAPAISNRLWAHYFGRGLIEPLDDLRATNPASNEPLLVDLAKHMRDLKYDLRAFTRTLLTSRTYQLTAATVPGNADDEQNFSHALPRTLPAEVLLDAICQVTGIPEKFTGWPAGYRAIQVWDNRMPSFFFQIFGRPVRFSVCECERGNEPSIAQALHLMNSPEITAKIRDKHGVARKLADSQRPLDDIIDELYLSTLARRPTDKERTLLLEALPKDRAERHAAVEDALWALLNTKEFIYNH
jgi:hypothetical protein